MWPVCAAAKPRAGAQPARVGGHPYSKGSHILGGMTCDSSQILNTRHKGKSLKMPWEASKAYLVATNSLWPARQPVDAPPILSGSRGHSGGVTCRDDVQGRVIRDAGGICQTCQFLTRGSGLSARWALGLDVQAGQEMCSRRQVEPLLRREV